MYIYILFLVSTNPFDEHIIYLCTTFSPLTIELGYAMMELDSQHIRQIWNQLKNVELNWYIAGVLYYSWLFRQCVILPINIHRMQQTDTVKQICTEMISSNQLKLSSNDLSTHSNVGAYTTHLQQSNSWLEYVSEVTTPVIKATKEL
jgi:hypothetical protein